MRRYLLENIEIFYVSVRSMGAIMYSFAEADNPLISKKIRPTARILQTAPVVYQMDDGRLLRRLHPAQASLAMGNLRSLRGSRSRAP